MALTLPVGEPVPEPFHVLVQVLVPAWAAGSSAIAKDKRARRSLALGLVGLMGFGASSKNGDNRVTGCRRRIKSPRVPLDRHPEPGFKMAAFLPLQVRSTRSNHNSDVMVGSRAN